MELRLAQDRERGRRSAADRHRDGRRRADRGADDAVVVRGCRRGSGSGACTCWAVPSTRSGSCSGGRSRTPRSCRCSPCSRAWRSACCSRRASSWSAASCPRRCIRPGTRCPDGRLRPRSDPRRRPRRVRLRDRGADDPLCGRVGARARRGESSPGSRCAAPSSTGRSPRPTTCPPIPRSRRRSRWGEVVSGSEDRTVAAHRDLVATLFPQLALDEFGPIVGGWTCDTYRVRSRVDRAAPSHTVRAVERVLRQIEVLPELSAEVSAAVPMPELVSREPVCMAYRALPGDPCARSATRASGPSGSGASCTTCTWCLRSSSACGRRPRTRSARGCGPSRVRLRHLAAGHLQAQELDAASTAIDAVLDDDAAWRFAPC